MYYLSVCTQFFHAALEETFSFHFVKFFLAHLWRHSTKFVQFW